MKIVIIGSKGFIGSHLTNFFNEKKIFVIGCDVLISNNDNNYYQIDNKKTDYSTLFSTYNFDVCINCSGSANVSLSFQDPLNDYTLNTFNVFKIVDTIRKISPDCKFINLSSAAVYGNPTKLPINEANSCNPISPYGKHKLQAEEICTEFNQLFSLKTCSLRLFSAYGEGQKKQLMWDVYHKFLNDSKIELFGTGNETRDFIHIEDIVQAIDCVIRNAAFSGEVINLANGVELSTATISSLFKAELNSNKQIFFNNIIKKGDPIAWKSDISKLESLGYKQTISIELGIKKYISWIKELK